MRRNVREGAKPYKCRRGLTADQRVAPACSHSETRHPMLVVRRGRSVLTAEVELRYYSVRVIAIPKKANLSKGGGAKLRAHVGLPGCRGRDADGNPVLSLMSERKGERRECKRLSTTARATPT
jgi:hypothetical protein